MAELIAGLSLGLGSGIAPGPLLALVVTSTLERGFAAGLRVATAPLITDAPIVALSVALAGSLPSDGLRALGAVGGLVVIGLGVRTVMSPSEDSSSGHGDLWRGVVVNALSPHPWLFWITAGGPLLVAAWRKQAGLGVAFLAGFYGLLVGTKVVVAAAVAVGRRRLGHRSRRRLVAAGGVLLAAGGTILLVESLRGAL